MDYEKTLEELEETIAELIEENKMVPIIVEGEKDESALRKLGMTGEIIRVNAGVSLANFCDRLARKYQSIILLTDWDMKGGHLFSAIKKQLKGRVVCTTKYRDVIAKRSMIRTLEGLPSWLNTLKEKVNERKTYTFSRLM